jgi:hypothetical protein
MPETQSDTTQQNDSTGRSIEVKTLVIAALAAVAAAVVTSTFWQKGALISTALTPVIVTLVQEALRRPAEKIGATASRVTAVPARGVGALATTGQRRAGGDEPAGPRGPAERERLGVGGNGAGWPGAGEGSLGGPPPPGPPPPLGATRRPGERTVPGRKRFRLKLALVTGLAAFALAVGVLTIPELVFGGSVASDGGTTLFSGDQADSQPADEEQAPPTGDPESDQAAPSDSAESQAVPEEESEPAPAPEEQTTEETAPLPEEEPAPVPPE